MYGNVMLLILDVVVSLPHEKTILASNQQSIIRSLDQIQCVFVSIFLLSDGSDIVYNLSFTYSWLVWS